MSSKSDRRALAVILGAFATLAIAYSVVVPLGEAPDEASHWSYVQYLTMHQRLPSTDGAVAGEAHQPPLYYLLGALVSFWVPDQQFELQANPDWDPLNSEIPNLLLHTRQEDFPYHGGALAWHLVRLVSIILGTITVWATYHLAQELFPGNRWLALTAATFVAFIPQFTFLSAVVNNDNLVITLASLCLLLFLRSERDARPIIFALVGILLGLAVLAKLSALVLWAPLALLMLVRKPLPIGQRVARFTLTFALATGIASSWIIYNAIVFGDPAGFARMAEGFSRTQAMTRADWVIYADRMYWSFWGKFGGMTNIGMPLGVYAALTMFLILGLVGDLFLIKDWRANRLPNVAQQGMLTFGLFGIILIASHIQFVNTMLGIDQARQIFPALPPLGVLVAAGILRLVRKPVVPALIVMSAMGVIGLTNTFTIASAYTSTSQFAIIASANPSSSSMDFGNQIRVLAFRIDPRSVAPGDTVTVEVQWQALTNISENYWLLLQLGGATDLVVNKEGVPSGGRLTTDWWQKDQVLTSSHRLVIPSDLESGPYLLQLGLHPSGRWDWLSVRGVEMLTLGNIVVEKPR